MELLPNKEERLLRYDFRATEIHELAVSLAQKNQQLDSIADEKKSVMSQYKSQEDLVKMEVSLLSGKVASGYEMRKVECEVKYHFPEQGKKTFIRSDDGQHITEKMSSEEWNLFNQTEDDYR